MNEPKTPLDSYMRHIARANTYIYKEVIDNIHNDNNDER